MSAEFNEELLCRYLAEAEAEMLRALPTEKELHHRFSRRFRRNMRALIRYERRSPKMRYYVHQMRNAAAVFVLVIAMAFVLTMSVEAARVKLFSFFTQVFTELTSVKVDGNAGDYIDSIVLMEPTYIPDGYKIKTKEKYQHCRYEIFYINHEQIEILYEQEMLSAGEYIFDTEDAYVETRQIAEQKIFLIEKDDFSQVYWYDDECFYTLSGIIDLRELVKMAESVIKKYKT